MIKVDKDCVSHLWNMHARPCITTTDVVKTNFFFNLEIWICQYVYLDCINLSDGGQQKKHIDARLIESSSWKKNKNKKIR